MPPKDYYNRRNVTEILRQQFLKEFEYAKNQRELELKQKPFSTINLLETEILFCNN